MTLSADSQEKLDNLREQEEEDLALILSKKYGIGYINLHRTAISTDALRLISEKDARIAEIAPYHIQGKEVFVALRTPNSEETKKILHELEFMGYKTFPYMTSKNSLQYAWKHYKDISFATETTEGILTISNEEIQRLTTKLDSIKKISEEVTTTLQYKHQYQITRMFEAIIAGALSHHASDIHFEPSEQKMHLRFRLDGVLVEITSIDLPFYFSLLTRIKLLSGLKINVNESPQDGRFSVKLEEKEIEIRTSILPGGFGESIVLRILDPASINISLETLGISPHLLKQLLIEIEKPNGMILNTGPTGSGKTTMLYAFMKKVLTSKIKIITIEDPIEYHLDGVVQTQINKKDYTFAGGLRSALRQDPDIIMVGEIRDHEVASTAVHAALTGHLVFSTLHTNNAAGTFPRLVDIGIDPSMIASSINVTIAQRLLRTLQPNKKKAVLLEGKDKVFVDTILDGIVDKTLIPENTSTMWIPDVAEGEQEYRGRVGIFEAIFMTREIETVIRQNLTTREIEDVAKKQGFLSMREDAIVKVLQGVTTLSEVRRVLGDNLN